MNESKEIKMKMLITRKLARETTKYKFYTVSIKLDDKRIFMIQASNEKTSSKIEDYLNSKNYTELNDLLDDKTFMNKLMFADLKYFINV